MAPLREIKPSEIIYTVRTALDDQRYQRALRGIIAAALEEPNSTIAADPRRSAITFPASAWRQFPAQSSAPASRSRSTFSCERTADDR